MTYITKRDRETMRLIEAVINEFTGYDKDYYLDMDRMGLSDRVMRYAWIYEVYSRTMLDQIQLSETMGRNQSNISRAIANAEQWIKKPKNKYHKQLKNIHNEIERRILERGNI
jgi:hypothetical protein